MPHDSALQSVLLFCSVCVHLSVPHRADGTIHLSRSVIFFSMVELFIHQCFLSDIIYSVAILYKYCSCPIKCMMFSDVLQQSLNGHAKLGNKFQFQNLKLHLWHQSFLLYIAPADQRHGVSYQLCFQPPTLLSVLGYRIKIREPWWQN